jgi:hypothetical protein
MAVRAIFLFSLKLHLIALRFASLVGIRDQSFYANTKPIVVKVDAESCISSLFIVLNILSSISFTSWFHAVYLAFRIVPQPFKAKLLQFLHSIGIHHSFSVLRLSIFTSLIRNPCAKRAVVFVVMRYIAVSIDSFVLYQFFHLRLPLCFQFAFASLRRMAMAIPRLMANSDFKFLQTLLARGIKQIYLQQVPLS